MIGNVLNLLGVVAYWQWIVQGLILLLAVALYAIDLALGGALSRHERFVDGWRC